MLVLVLEWVLWLKFKTGQGSCQDESSRFEINSYPLITHVHKSMEGSSKRCADLYHFISELLLLLVHHEEVLAELLLQDEALREGPDVLDNVVDAFALGLLQEVVGLLDLAVRERVPVDRGQAVRVALAVGGIPPDALPVSGLIEEDLRDGENIEDAAVWIRC